MTEKQPKEWLKWICSSQNLDELRTNYDRWAETYETDVGGVWDPIPMAAALMLAEYLENKYSTILDVGVGTGLVGVALVTLGFAKIIGIDISPAMLTKALAKDVYSTLVCCAIGDEEFKNLGKAGGIIATGVFAESHAGAAELSVLQQSIEPGGILVFTARQSFLPALQEVVERSQWTCLDSKVLPIYEDPIYLQAYKIGKPT